MQIFINESPVECREACTLTELLQQQGIDPVNIAIAIDNTGIPKATWSDTTVKEGADILIIKAVQGG